MPTRDDPFTIRKATARDAATLVAFNKAIARETEHRELRHDVISAGVAALFDNPALGFYLVAEHRDDVVGSLMVTTEWSDWRNGVFWWVQSVYVTSHLRRQGVYRRLYQHAQSLADAEPNVCGFRLYVERDNSVAQQTYGALGMKPTPYLIYEHLDPNTNFLEP